MPQPIATGMTCHIAAPAGSPEERISWLITLVAAIVSSAFVESAVEIDASFYAVLDIDADTYGRVKDDLMATFPTIQELAATLFGSPC